MVFRIINLVKQVPVPLQMRMGEDGLMDRTKAKSMINVDCGFAMEQGLELKSQIRDSELLIVSMGPSSFEQSHRKAISLGFDQAVLLSDRRLGGSDTYATGLALGTLLRKIGVHGAASEPFVIFAGRQTSDGDTAHVPSQVAETLGIPQATFVERVEYKGDHLICRRIIEGGYQILKVPIPCLISVAPTATVLRRPSLNGAMRARAAQITTWNLDQIGLRGDQVGLIGSPTIVARVVDVQRDRLPVTMIRGNSVKELVAGLISSLDRVAGAELDHKKKDHQAARSSTLDAGTGGKTDFPKVDFRAGARGVLTWVEMHGRKPAPSSVEILNPARKLADQLDTKVTSVMIGDDIVDAAGDIIAHGADEVIVVNDPRLREYANLPVTSVLAQIIDQKRPEIALFGATTSGRELAPRLASRVRAGVTADCTSLKVGEFVYKRKKAIMYPCLESIRPTYGESKLATIVGFWCPQMATARPGTFEPLLPDASRRGQVINFKPVLTADDFRVDVLETSREAGGAHSLFSADIIISGGRDCGELDQFRLIKGLVQALQEQGINADWGASRQAVDNGYAPYARQIGQTGKTVRPKIYVAIAISGAIQHLAGMKESEQIIAVDYNPGANIFRHSDFGIVRDYREVLPELIQQVKAGFTFGLGAPVHQAGLACGMSDRDPLLATGGAVAAPPRDVPRCPRNDDGSGREP